MFPFHCNHCFRRRKYDTSLQLFVSRCGHILCNDCVQENCCICTRPFKGIAINKDMPAPMAEYFSSPLKQYQHYKKVMKFHHDQEKRLVEHMCRTKEEENKKLECELKGFAKLNNSIRQQVEVERERIRKLREYITYFDRRLEQARYMTPPITAPPRPRYPARRHSIGQAIPNQNTLHMGALRFTQQTKIRPNIIYPQSPTLSNNNSSSITTEGTGKIKSIEMEKKKQRTPPPLLPFSQHRLLNPQFSFNTSV